jgi:hypothetical protein
MKAFIITTVVWSMVCVIGAFPVAGDTDGGGDPTVFYANCIDKKITSCDAKGILWNSRSQHLRAISRLAILKAIFLSDHREQLISEMEANGVATKTYTVDYYLNHQFHENLKSSFKPSSSLD